MSAAADPAMSDLELRLMRLSSAEQFLEFFAVRFDPKVVNVCRLHILKRFRQYLRREDGLAELDAAAMFSRYRALLGRAYDDYARAEPGAARTLGAFRDTTTHAIPLAVVRAALPSGRG